MSTFKEHQEAFCSVSGCKEFATRWIDTDGLPFFEDTFYLCPEHAEQLSADDSEAYLLTPEGQILKKEVAVYSCHDDCPVCE